LNDATTPLMTLSPFSRWLSMLYSDVPLRSPGFRNLSNRLEVKRTILIVK
jgi:hypothetical protein